MPLYAVDTDHQTGEVVLRVPPRFNLGYLAGLVIGGLFFLGFAALVTFGMVRVVLERGLRAELLIGVVFGGLFWVIGAGIASAIYVQLRQTTTVRLGKSAAEVTWTNGWRRRGTHFTRADGAKVRFGPPRTVRRVYVRPGKRSALEIATTGLVVVVGEQSFWIAKQLQGDDVAEVARALFDRWPQLRDPDDLSAQAYLGPVTASPMRRTER